MAKISTKHPDRQKTFGFRSFTEGLNTDISPLLLTANALSRCRNMKYAISKEPDGSSRVILKKRQGTVKISSAALSAGADVLACTYYKAQDKYILATATTLYYLDSSYAPVEIGTISGVPTFTEFHGKLIIHDSGITKAWDGTTFETLTSLVQDEAIETGDGATVAFSGTLSHPAVKSASLILTYSGGGVTKTITSDSDGILSGDVGSTELMPNAADRNLNTASAWTNFDFGTVYNESATLISGAVVLYVTASAANQYCYLPVASAPTTIGQKYTMTFSVAYHVGGFYIKSYDGTQTIGETSGTGVPGVAHSFTWTATTTGGYRIVAKATTSTGCFDNFTLALANSVNQTTGAYFFTCSTAPDNNTTVYAEYEEVDGAPKSTAGCVRAECLYMWGDADNPSRLWYSAPNDEDAWDYSTLGGYLDVNPLDGDNLMGALSFYDTMLCIKESSLHRIDHFPGDAEFQVVPLMQNMGAISTKTVMSDGELVSFLSPEGWVGMSSTQRFGDIQKVTALSERFQKTCVRYANSSAYTDYNQIDKQLWLQMNDGANYLTDIYVINLATGGQLSLYKFAFTSSCFKYVNGEMLIGGADGHLYRLVDDDSTFYDNAVSYAADTEARSCFADWGLPFNRKHNKQIMCYLYGDLGFTGNLKLYKDQNTGTFATATIALSIDTGDLIYNDNDTADLIYGASDYINELGALTTIDKKFNYRNLMFEITDLEGTSGVEFHGIDFSGAIIGLP